MEIEREDVPEKRETSLPRLCYIQLINQQAEEMSMGVFKLREAGIITGGREF